MKEGWKMVKLEDVSNLITDGDWIESKNQSSEGIRLIQTGNIGPGFFKDKSDSYRYISETTFTKLNCTEIFKGDCLVSRLPDPVGRACIIPDTKKRMITAVDCSILRFNSAILPKWFIYYSQSNEYYSKIDKESTGSTRKRISRKNLTQITIPLPPLEEQHRIVTILDATFEKIDKLKANAEENLKNAKALFQQVLAQELKPKEGWEEKKLGEVCEIVSSLVSPKEKIYRKMLHVGGANIQSENGRLIDLLTAEEEGLESGKYTFDDNMVLYNKIRPYLKKVARPKFCGLCSADMYPLLPKTILLRDYLYYILISEDFTKYAVLNSGRAGMPKVNRPTLFAYSFKLPPISEQHRIVQTLDALSEKCRRLETIAQQTIRECDALKQSILRQAFSGEL